MSSHRVDGQAARREVRAAKLPVPEVPRDEDEPFAARQSFLDDVPSVHRLEQVDDLRGTERREDRRLDARAAEMSVGVARDALDVGRAQLRHGGGELADDDVAPNAERSVAEPADAIADSTRGA